MLKQIYEKHKVVFEEQFKNDLLNICIHIYGKDSRKQFEERINNIEVHSKFTIEELKWYIKEHKGEQDFSLESQYIEEYERGKKIIDNEADKEKLQTQIKLLNKIKQELPQEEADKLQEEIEAIEERGKALGGFSKMDLTFLQMMEDLDITELKKVSEKYQLDEFEKTDIEPKDFVQEYFLDLEAIQKNKVRRINEKYSSYTIVSEECKDFDLNKDDLLDEYDIAGAYVQNLSEKTNYQETKDHIFINPFKEKELVLGTLAHEVLHSLERKISIDEESKTIHTTTGFDDKIPNVNTTLLSECIHDIILCKKIVPNLRQLGYGIHKNEEYLLKSLSTNEEFFDKFEDAILAARRGSIDILLDIVGKENFIKYAELQNNYSDKQSHKKASIIISKMEEYSRENLETRIGKITLPYQEKIQEKDNVQNEINELLMDKTHDRGEMDD